jgi:plasmid replication initiation protein
MLTDKTQLEPVMERPLRAIPGNIAVRDIRDLMTYPFFSLSKTKRTAPIDFQTGDITVRVEGSPEHGLATIWDLDILLWAASQLVEARDLGLATSRRIAGTPCEILRFIGRGTSARDYLRLRSALDRLQSTIVTICLRQPALPGASSGCIHRFSWITEWREGVELVLSDWFYHRVVEQCAVLTIDRAYFNLSGGFDRWLYRLVRKHAGRQAAGWRFDFRSLYAKSGCLSRFRNFASVLRAIVSRQRLPGYQLAVERLRNGNEILRFAAIPQRSLAPLVSQLARSMRAVKKL